MADINFLILILICVFIFYAYTKLRNIESLFDTDLNVNSSYVHVRTNVSRQIPRTQIDNRSYAEKIHSKLDTSPVLCDLKTRYCGNKNTVCSRIITPTTLISTEKGTVVYELPANKGTNEGYCVPNDKFLRSNKLSLVNKYKCNTNTGRRYTIMYRGKVIGACACKEPRIIDQTIPVFGDCDKANACIGGKLSGPDWFDEEIPVDLKRDFYCTDCPNDSVGDKDSDGYPICRNKLFSERSSVQEYEDEFIKIITREDVLLKIDDPALDPDFVKKLPKNSTRKIPNPCTFDAFTGKRLNRNECYLDFTVDSNGSRIYFCDTDSAGVATLSYADDYLRNNGGNYANACYSFLTEKYDNNKIQWILEYFNLPGGGKERYPLIGTRIPKKSIHKYLHTKLGLNKKDDNEYVILYNQKQPANYFKQLLPLRVNNIEREEAYKDHYVEYDDFKTKKGLPAIVNVLSSIPSTVLAQNFPVIVRKCKDLGKIGLGTWPIPTFPSKVQSYVDIEEFNLQLNKAFVTCITDNKIYIKPNIDANSFTGILKYQNGIFSPFWEGDDSLLNKYIKLLPNIF